MTFLLIVFFGSNFAGYLLARDQIETAVVPTTQPKETAFAFSPITKIILPNFTLSVPNEISGYFFIGAYPDELSLMYADPVNESSMLVKYNDYTGYEIDFADAHLPQSLMLRNGLTGPLIHEIFAGGPMSDGISLNPYKAVREGFAARLRGDFSAKALPSKLSKVWVVGPDTRGQVWRIYSDKNQVVTFAEGTFFQGSTLGEISITFNGRTPAIAPVVRAFGDAILFTPGDVRKNALMADECLDENDGITTDQPWESACRQGHLVALLVSDMSSVDAAKSLYGDYLGFKCRICINALFDLLHEPWYESKETTWLLGEMKKTSPWLVEKEAEE